MPVAKLKNAYDILGVTASDDPATVRKAWLTLVRAYHPDMYRGDRRAANEKLAEINAAYDVVEAGAAVRAAGRGEEKTPTAAPARARADAPRRDRAARQAASKAAMDAQMLAAELEALRAKRAEKERAAVLAQRARAARRPERLGQGGYADEVAARTARLAFVSARRALEDDYVSGALVSRYA